MVIENADTLRAGATASMRGRIGARAGGSTCLLLY